MQQFDISMFVPGLPFDGNTLKEKSLGGSETAALYMAKALAKLGQHVRVFSNTQTISRDDEGVQYYPLGMWTHYARNTPHDITIVQRTPQAFSTAYNSKLNVLWQHDLTSSDQAQLFRGSGWNIDMIMVLSRFMRDQYTRVTGLPEELFYLTRNGIDTKAFLPLPHYARKMKRLVYASRPERGLDVLLGRIMPKLLAADPEIELCIAGYDNPVSHFNEFYTACRRMGANLGDRVRWSGALTKQQLYELYTMSAAYLYPTPSPVMPNFSEVSCITAMECQAAGLPIITSARGALPETVAPGAGVLIEGDPSSDAYVERFVAETLSLLRDEPAWSAMSRTGREAGKLLDWSGVAEQWINEFERSIRDNNRSPERLVRHFWRQSDIIAARDVVNKMEVPGNEALTELLRPFDFAFKGREGFKEQYAKTGETVVPELYASVRQEIRYNEMLQWMRTRDDVKSVLDYGCGIGAHATFLSQDAGKHTVGVDIDEATIELAKCKAAEVGATDVEFMQGEWDSIDQLDGAFDCVVMQEVLEHVFDPVAVLTAVERKAKIGGWVYLTVPFGPWEYTRYNTADDMPNHIWHFDQHDLRDMLSGKQDLSVSPMYGWDSGEMAEPLGWWVITYRADHKPIGAIDIERKKWLCRPRQTVSVLMIVGGELAEDTLMWCLKSLKHVHDEVIIADCGMSPMCHAVIAEMQSRGLAIRVVQGSDPKTVGFEVARNAALAHCHMDWVLWIDADERLLQQRNVHKYLRANMYDGYGIRQHHFSVDAGFTPDMPVRLFRNNGNIRFYGALHEHPETELNKGPGPVVVISDAHIAHVGYLHEEVRQQRFRRNFPLLKMDMDRYPDRLLQKHIIMRDKMVLVREALQQNGNRLDAGVVNTCREVIELYRKHFMGKGSFANSDSLQYYSDAVRVLGEGFEATLAVDVDRVNAPQANPVTHRFANTEDFLAELNFRAREKVKQFDAPEV